MADTLIRPDRVEAPTVDDIFKLAPDPEAGRRRTREVLSCGVELMRTTTDQLAVTVLDVVLRELADVADRLATYELMLSEAQTARHQQGVEIARLREQHRTMLDLARAAPREDVRRLYTDDEWRRVEQIARGGR